MLLLKYKDKGEYIMKNVMKNKKGFTLVELLAVIVILALIMGIAVVAMSGVIDSSEKNSARRTAANIIDGVRTKLMLEGELESGTYYFTNAILEKGGKTSPFGGDYLYYDTTAPVTGATLIGSTGVYRAASKIESCTTGQKPSFVTITVTDGAPTEYKICLTSGAANRAIWGTESDILADKDDVIIQP